MSSYGSQNYIEPAVRRTSPSNESPDDLFVPLIQDVDPTSFGNAEELLCQPGSSQSTRAVYYTSEESNPLCIRRATNAHGINLPEVSPPTTTSAVAKVMEILWNPQTRTFSRDAIQAKFLHDPTLLHHTILMIKQQLENSLTLLSSLQCHATQAIGMHANAIDQFKEQTDEFNLVLEYVQRELNSN